MPGDPTTLLPPRPPLRYSPHEAEAAIPRWSSNQKKINASQPADRFTLAVQCGALPLAKDLRWSGLPDSYPSTHLNRHQTAGLVTRKDVYLQPCDAQVTRQDLPTSAYKRSCRLSLCGCSDFRPMVRHREILSGWAYRPRIG